jgi:hypothetical protein
MGEKFRGLRGALSTKVKTAIHEVFISLPQIDSNKTNEIFEWKRLPALKESFDKLFKQMSNKDETYMDSIIGKVWDNPKKHSKTQIAWAISIAKVYLNPKNSFIKIGEDLTKESFEKYLVSIISRNEILRNITKFSNKIL